MNKKAKWLLFPLGLLMVFGCVVPSQAEEPDDSIAGLRAQLSQLEQRLAIAEQVISQVSGYVSKGVEENRRDYHQISSDVKEAVAKFNSGYDSIENNQKQHQADYQQLVAKYSSLEARFSELESKIIIRQNQLARSDRSGVVRSRPVRQSNSQPPTANFRKSDDLRSLSRYRRTSSYQQRLSSSSSSVVRSNRKLIEPEYYQSRPIKRVVVIRRVSNREVKGQPQEGSFYTRINTGAIAQWFDRLIP